MINEVEKRIEEWAEWQLQEDSCSVSVLGKIQILGPAGAAIKGQFEQIGRVMPRRIAEVESAIFALPVPRWVDVVLLEYIGTETQEVKANNLSIGLATYKRDLRDLQIFMAPLLGVRSTAY